jgi:hypothetical protein
VVTKLGPLCKVKLLKDKGDTLVVRSPEKAARSDSLDSLPLGLAEEQVFENAVGGQKSP